MLNLLKIINFLFLNRYSIDSIVPGGGCATTTDVAYDTGNLTSDKFPILKVTNLDFMLLVIYMFASI